MVATPFSIREIGKADRSDVASLLDAARTSSEQFRGSEVLEELLAKVNVSELPGRVAVVDGEVKGLVAWTIAERMLTIEVLYVDPESRGVGIGEGLVLAAMEHARSAGLERIAGRALPGDRETKNVYERTGLVSQVILVGRTLT